MFTLPDNVKVLNLPEQVEKNREDIASISSRVSRVDARTSDLGQQIKLHDDDIEKLKTAVTNVDTGSINTHYISVHGPVDVSGKLIAGNDLEVDGKIILNSADDVVDGNGNKLIASVQLDEFKTNYFKTEARYKYASKSLSLVEEALSTPFDDYYTDVSNMYSHSKFVNQSESVVSVSIPPYVSATEAQGFLERSESIEISLGSFSDRGVNFHFAFNGCNAKKIAPAEGASVKPTTLQYAFGVCPNLEEIGAFDCSLCVDHNPFIGWLFASSKVKHIHCTHFKVSFDISGSTQFETSDLVEIISNLDPVSAPQTLTMGATNLAKLTQDQILVATGKGWTLA